MHIEVLGRRRDFCSPRFNGCGIGGRFGFGADIQSGLDGVFAGNADVLTFEPRNVSGQSEWTVWNVWTDFQRHKEHDLIVVTVGGHFDGWQLYGERPQDVASRHAS